MFRWKLTGSLSRPLPVLLPCCLPAALCASNDGARRDTSWIFELKFDTGGKKVYEGDATYTDYGGGTSPAGEQMLGGKHAVGMANEML